MEKPDKKNIGDIFALTPMQEGMLFHYLKDGGNSQYFEQLCLDISGEIDIKLFQQAWNVVIDTNEMLRTAFRWKKIRKPVQVVFNTYTVKLKYYDFSNRDISERKKSSDEIITKDQWEKFDLYRVPFRVTLCKIDRFKYRMIISNHHILYDGWSNGIILHEFFTVYINLVNKKKPRKMVKTKFKEFVKWLNKLDKKEQEKFWKEYLKSFEEPTELPVKIKRTRGKQGSSWGNLRISIKKDTREKLERFIYHHKITIAALLYCTWGILLQGYNNTNDVIFGTTVSGRSAKIKGIENVVGLFINTIPLRLKIGGGEKIKDLLYHVNDILIIREKYESTPLVDIKGYSEVGNNSELFDSIVVLENYPLDRDLMGEMVVNSYSIIETTSYDLTVGITIGEDIEIDFSYPGELFEETVIRRLSCHFINIMENILEDHERDIPGLEILSAKEKKQILDDFNRTVEEYPKNKAIHELFAEQVDRTPDNIALIFEVTELTYRELNKRSDKLTSLLRERGVGPGTIVGIMVERSPEMIKGILAILKAGGAYLPIDPDYPEERKQYMLKDSGTKILLTRQEIAGLSSPGAFNNSPKGTTSFGIWNLEFGISPRQGGHLAYIIYTSGSTGKPKGVMVENESVVNILLTLQRQYPLNESDVYAFKTPYIFDVSVTELFGWFLAGGKLVVLVKGDEKDPQKILDTIERTGVTHINFVPSMFNILEEVLQPRDTRRISGLKYIFLAGETLLAELVNKFRRLGTSIRLENLYGPTEGTVYSSYYSLEQWDGKGSIPIGKPVANTMLLVLDKTNRLQPIGVPGELCIGGKGLARGYLNQPELTAERFCLRRPGGLFLKKLPPWTPRKNFLLKGSHKDYMQSCNHAAMQPCNHATRQYHSPPQYSITPLPHHPIYLTGDLARWLPDGNMEFLGRIDHQVKIRGFRIEPGEIENQLLNCKEVKEAVVTVKKDETGSQFLCAYIVSHRKPDFNIPRLKYHLKQKLPGYMIPAYFVFLEKIPLTPGGKVDRKSLPGPDIKSAVEYSPPGNDREKLLVDIWANLLEIDKTKIGVNDNFFELGGHSLKATLLMARIHKKLDIEIPLSQLFKSPTIRGLTLYMVKIGKGRYLSIEPVEEKEYYVLSSAQKRLYFLHQAHETTVAYNMTSSWLLEGALDKNRLENTFQKLVQRHDSLRTSFWMIEEELVQGVHEKEVVEFAIEYYLGTEDKAQTTGGSSATHLSSEFIRPFDLSQAPLLRVGVVELGKEKNLLMVDMHHIISDGVSTQVLIRDFMAFYSEEELPGMKFRYKDYAQWQDREKKSAKLLEQGGYWKKAFEGEIPVLELPTDYARHAVQWFEGSSLSFEIDRESTGALKSLALEEGATLYMVLLVLFNIFLAKISNQEDIVIGTPVAGRKHADLQKIIGMFVNTLPMRNYPVGEKDFSTFLAEIKENTLLAFENQEYPYEDLVEHVIINRDMSRNPLFDACFLLQNMEVSKLAIPGMKLTPYEYETITSKFDLTLEGMETEEALLFRFEYSTKLFKPETIEGFVNYFKNLLSGVHENKKRKLSELEIISAEEKHRVLDDFNNTSAEYPKDKTLQQLFEEQVSKTPNHIVVVGMAHDARNAGGAAAGATTQLTYRELNRKANQLVWVLKEKGVKPDTIVAVMGERSIEMIAGLLGILKAGGAYLPIDPDSPAERIIYTVKDSGAKILLAAPGTQVKAGVEKRFEKIINISTLLSSSTSLSPPSTCRVSPTNLVYIMYTSGSTGQPKGVLVEHGNVVRLVVNTNYVELNEETRILQTGAPVFDATTFEIWGSLLNGGQLVLVNKELILDALQLHNAIEKNDINTLWLTSPLFNQLTRDNCRIFSNLKYLLVGGDVLSPQFINLVRNKKLKIINGYGPTENTTFSTTFLIDKEYKDAIPIGSPISNSTALILNQYGKHQPIGIFGELSVGGDGVSRGYLNSPELTQEKFDQDLLDYQDYPHKKKKENYKKFLPGESGCFTGAVFSKSAPPGRRRQKIYKTGDIVRWLPDGNIEFSGRSDNQVKIRGFRIELSEIEHYLLRHDAISEAVVVASVDENQEKYLCAYIVSDGEPSISQLRHYLSGELPEYMVPSSFVVLDRIPLTPNGKVDRRRLPEPAYQKGQFYTAPRDSIEKKLSGIWSETLGRAGYASIGIDDNFFQSGGHSLKAIALVSKIHKVFDVNIPLVEMFKNLTIRKLSQYIKEAAHEQFYSIEAAEEKEYYGLSSAQQRLYFLQQMDEKGTAYNIPSAWELKGNPDKNRLENAFEALIRRHESLRTSFKIIGEEPVQRIHKEVQSEIEHYQPLVNSHLSSVIRHLSSEFIRPFDLSQAPLLRMGLMKLPHTSTAPSGHPSQEGNSQGSCILMIDMHHIISDGMSAGVLVQDFAALYTGDILPEMRLRYKDYAAWQNHEKMSIRVQEQALYWQKEFKAEPPVLELPTDYVRPTIQRFEGSSLDFEIGRETTCALNVLALEAGATLYMVLLTIYTIFLSKISTQEDIVIGTPVAGRRHADLEKIVGMFVNTLALRNYPAGEKTFIRFLAEVKEKTLPAFENQEYQYEDLVEQVTANRDVSRNPLFDASFLFQNMEIAGFAVPGLKFTPYKYKTITSKFDLTLEGMETEETLLFQFEYNTKLFKPETIKRFVNYFKNLVSGIHEDKKSKLSELEIISEEEQHQVLYNFNDTKADYPKDKTLHELFSEQVEKNPDNVALTGQIPNPKSQIPNKEEPFGQILNVFGEEVSITYKKLNENVNQMARSLIKKGVKPDTIVGIMVERSIEMIIGILGILKAGGAYMPIDPDYPEDRINYILADSAAKILLAADAINRVPTPHHLHRSPAPVTAVSSSSTLTSTSTCQVSPANLAYIIYTSGSTGRPKGVLVQHGSVVNILVALFKKYPFSKRDTYLLKTSYMFDVSVSELFGWFLGGGRLAILEPAGEKEPEKILDCIERIGISHINFVPSMFGVFLEVLDSRKIRQLSGLKYIFLAGEALSPYLVNKFKGLNPGIVLENIYGPTESTIYASQYPLSEWKGIGNISIGKPMQNIKLYILGKYNQLQPIGVSGELCISGAGLARGYLNRPGLTAEKFDHDLWDLQDYHDEEKKLPGKRIYMSHMSYIYKTGDLARWLPDGNIEFLGRIDHQVKIRGFRIELEEIESQLLTYKGIKDAVVLAGGDESGDKYLCAYIVRDGSEPEQAFDGQELQEYLFKFLPDYMVPSYFVEIEKVPLGTSGKIDRRALPGPERKARQVYTAPGDEIEQKLVELWEEVLFLELIGIDDNFFQLGGHSLKATVLAAKIYKTFNIRLPLQEIFKRPTIRSLSQYIAGTVNEYYLSIKAAEEKEYYVLFSAQKRLYLLYQADKEATGYNMPEIVTLEGKIEKEKLENTFKQLIRRHEGLRTSFEQVKGEPVQRVRKEVQFEIEHHQPLASEEKQTTDDRGQTTENRPATHLSSSDVIRHLSSEFIRPFDLTRAPLLRVGLMKLPHTPAALRHHPSQEGKEHKYLLIMDMHHIISDSVSMGILVRELMALSEEIKLPPLEIQYKDFSEWWNKEKGRASVKQQEAFWVKEFEGEIPVLQLPTDYPRPLTRSYAGGAVDFELGKEETAAVNQLAKEEGVTLFMVLLALYNVLLARLSGQEDVVVGTPVVGRYREELYHTIGMFVNTLALRNFPKAASGFKDFLKQLKEQTLKAFENQNYPFEQLVERVAAQRDNTRNPIFDVMFALQNFDIPAVIIPGLVLEPFSYKQNIAKFDLNLIGVEKDQLLCFTFEYSAKLFETTTIERFICYFKDIVKAILENRDIKLSDIKISLEVSGVEPTDIQDAKGDFEF